MYNALSTKFRHAFRQTLYCGRLDSGAPSFSAHPTPSVSAVTASRHRLSMTPIVKSCHFSYFIQCHSHFHSRTNGTDGSGAMRAPARFAYWSNVMFWCMIWMLSFCFNHIQLQLLEEWGSTPIHSARSNPASSHTTCPLPSSISICYKPPLHFSLSISLSPYIHFVCEISVLFNPMQF